MRIISGDTAREVYFVAVDATDRVTRETGLTGFTVQRSRDGSVPVAMDTPTVTEMSAAAMPGVYKLLLDEDMDITAGVDAEEMAYHITQAAMDPVTLTVGLFRRVANTVWDEILTGGVHNIPTSAGRRLRGLQEFQGYEGGAVWLDTVNGVAGTTSFENGTVDNPVLTIEDVNTLLAALGLSRVHIVSGSNVILTAPQINQVFDGQNWTLALGGQSIAGSTFIGANVSGVPTGVGTKQVFIRCTLGVTSLLNGCHLIECGLSGTQTLIEAGSVFYDQCHSAVAGMGTITFDFGAGLNASSLNVRHHSGGFTIENMGAGTGTYEATFEGWGQLLLAASNSATANVSIRGHWQLTDNSGGAVVVTKADLQASVDSILVDTTNIKTRVLSVADVDLLSKHLAGVLPGLTTGTPTTTSSNTDLIGFGDGELINAVIIFTGGVARGQRTRISAYAATGGVVTYDAITTAPAAGDAFIVI